MGMGPELSINESKKESKYKLKHKNKIQGQAQLIEEQKAKLEKLHAKKVVDL